MPGDRRHPSPSHRLEQPRHRLRGRRKFDEAIAVSEHAVRLFTETADAFRTGQALGELAVTLAESGASPADVRATLLRAADAYEQAGAADEAAGARAEADKST
ncbi:hypothetical protein ABGB09_24560 [Streptomyces sp. B8F3]|uniref:hypothetical protein n=1 Tax=Streptomyces sp. B8F3 TaxID=3153573 RepID=UPI00325CFC28